MTKILNVLSKRQYVEDGNVKTVWYKIGTERVAKNGWRYLKLFHLPNEEFYVVEPKEGFLDDSTEN